MATNNPFRMRIRDCEFFSRSLCRPPHINQRNNQPITLTLVERLVVISIIGILVALLAPVLSKGKQKAQGIACLNNGKQMMAAITMYASEYIDFFPPNPDGGNTVPGHNWC